MNKWSLWAKGAEEDLAKRKVILLFYKEFEKDKFFKYDRYLKRVVRPIYDLTHHRQKKTGFAVSFELSGARSRRSDGMFASMTTRSRANTPITPWASSAFPCSWTAGRYRTPPCSAPRFSTIRGWLRI